MSQAIALKNDFCRLLTLVNGYLTKVDQSEKWNNIFNRYKNKESFNCIYHSLENKICGRILLHKKFSFTGFEFFSIVKRLSIKFVREFCSIKKLLLGFWNCFVLASIMFHTMLVPRNKNFLRNRCKKTIFTWQIRKIFAFK